MNYFSENNVTLVNLKGTNASRKSTKMTYLVKYLQEKSEETIILETGIITKINEIKYYYFGKYAPKKDIWVSLDSSSALLTDGKIETRLKHFQKIIEKYGVQVIFCEGYFNNISKTQDSIENLKKFGIDRYEYFFLYPDSEEELRKNMGLRSKQCTDYKASIEQMEGFKKLFSYFKENSPEFCVVERTDIYSPRDFYIQKFFGEKRNYENKPASSLDDF